MTSPNWLQLTIKTNYHRDDKARALSLIKNVLERVTFLKWFYTWDLEDDLIVLKLRFTNLTYIGEGSFKDISTYLHVLIKGGAVKDFEQGPYFRNHIVEALERTSNLAVGMEFRPSREDAAYLVHCVLENLFFDNEEELAIYNELMVRIQKKMKVKQGEQTINQPSS